MRGVINKRTRTIHKLDADDTFDERSLASACGALNHVPPQKLRGIDVDTAAANDGTARCGRCFDGVGGY